MPTVFLPKIKKQLSMFASTMFTPIMVKVRGRSESNWCNDHRANEKLGRNYDNPFYVMEITTHTFLKCLYEIVNQSIIEVLMNREIK